MGEPNYRRCVSCRKLAPKTEFWRIVRVHASNTVQMDRGMGRSVYLCPQIACLRAAQKKHRLARALKASVPDQVYTTLWQRLDDKPSQDASTQLEALPEIEPS